MSIKEQLASEDVNTRIEALTRFSEASESELAELFKIVSEDFNHQVREEAVEKILLHPESFRLFLADPDPQVRISIINKSVEIRNALAEAGKLEKPETVIAQIKTLQSDSVSEVRSALARVLYKHCGTEATDESRAFVLANIVPILDNLLNDRHDDVRIAASLNIKEITIIFGFDFVFEQLYNSLHHMLTDTQWRVRNNAVELLFGLALVCSQDFFDANLFQFLIQFLQDPCNKVRQFALSSLPTLAAKFGEEWLKKKLVVALKDLAESQNYLHRETYLLTISALVSFFPVQYQSNYVFQPMIRMLKDSVYNVVLLAIELLSKHKDSIHPFRRQYELKPILESLVDNSPVTIKDQASALLADCQ
ncbi:HEAT repeat family protein [Trichomonas vaginalis G3]|uniref:HEAT repeat family protein n=1 Tax=Trichomonas vaginalis (strain ATCC PRA-98 / G3) TaxID=412133 RepID=A2DEH5_TRIV3|nr:meiotic spindle elongation [Trichomonas vaginalis G3]EAY21102.1 HEAT repeat family protein [Trichomonas vaginalis G3]KAI5539969.1 meiotic spindle elongation [Trichomonas vaginalis G3]|eukprot:XP_001582088.1 HEAT repeat family protein [Trichomonas vaginalis G3]